MQQYSIPNTSTTFVVLTTGERDALTTTLESAMDWIALYGEPHDWVDHDRAILPGMMRLNGTIGNLSRHLHPTRYSLGLDPTTQQIKKLNRALKKINFTKVALPRPSTQELDNASMRNRMDSRRSEMVNWVANNLAKLRPLFKTNPELLENLTHSPNKTLSASEIKFTNTIRDLLEVTVTSDGLWEGL